MTLLLTGITGLTGSYFIPRYSQACPNLPFLYLTRSNRNSELLERSNLKWTPILGNSSSRETWQQILEQYCLETIVHIASIRHVPFILEALALASQTPRLIIVGTTGVYSQYNQYSAGYQAIEQQLKEYPGSSCLLRPTMIYGSHRDKNLHKLIKFCDRYGFFPVFGSGNCLLQPVHADDLAKALLSVLLNPTIKGSYDLSGGTVVTFRELLALVEKLLGKPVRPLYVPYNLGLGAATFAEKILGARSPVRREQILRLQEDKAYSYEAAKRDFGYEPRSLEIGLAQEIEILRAEGII